MKRTAMFVWGLCFAILGQVAAQQADEPRRDDKRPPRLEDLPVKPEILTEAQKEQVKTILSRYGSKTLTAEEARAIHEDFRQAGLRCGAAMGDIIRSAGFDPDKLRDLAPPPEGEHEGHRSLPDRPNDRPWRDDDRPGVRDRGSPEHGNYSIEQAISDRAQINTIAFDGLAFLTGDTGCNTFLPPGKVADFCGFQYMRDLDDGKLGHNTSFVPRVANNILHILTDEQKTQLLALAKEQETLLTNYAMKRFPLIYAFQRQLDGDIPQGSTGLNNQAVMQYTAELYEIDGQLSHRRAQVLGSIIRSLNLTQKEELGRMAFSNSSTWPEMEDQIDKRSMSHTAHVAVMTYASELFSWYAGNIEADVYFCPERHATYFGSFYMKDIPAMGNPNYSISTSLTGDRGEAFLDALSEPQRTLVTNLVEQQRSDLNEIVLTRRAIATELRRFMKESTVDKNRVMTLSKRYGELDGEISCYYAMAFSQVARTLTSEQKKILLKLRNLDTQYTRKSAYLYSQPIDMPKIPNTDFLFAMPVASGQVSLATTIPNIETGFILRSPEVDNSSVLPWDYTGDGDGVTLPLEWNDPPAETQSFALIMHHVPPEGPVKCYWILYNIPAGTRSLPKNVRDIGSNGSNSINGKAEYAPPHSKGPGPKIYVYTLYALSVPVKLDVMSSGVTRDVLLAAIQDRILDTAELQVVYSRPDGIDGLDRGRLSESARPGVPGTLIDPCCVMNLSKLFVHRAQVSLLSVKNAIYDKFVMFHYPFLSFFDRIFNIGNG